MYWFGPPREGDWVTARRPYSAGVVDALTGAETVRKGDCGVVLDDRTSGSLDPHLMVRFDTGWGTRDIHVPVRHLRVVSRGRGVGSFERRTSTMRMIQLGALLAMLVPVLWFVISYRRQTGSFDGIMTELAVGVVYSAFDMVESIITDPVKAVIFLVLSWLAYKLATGRLR